MSKSKTDPKRKAKVDKYKETQKQRNNMSQQLPEIPPVRQVPVWKSNQNIEMNGLEFEAIFNFINGVQGAYGAVQSIMQKNIVNGSVDIAFEKLNDEKTQYVPMTDDEQKPHKEEFAKMLDALKAQASQMVRREDIQDEPDQYPSQEGLPHIDALVDTSGNPLTAVK